jgi:hypothetical protein
MIASLAAGAAGSAFAIQAARRIQEEEAATARPPSGRFTRDGVPAGREEAGATV